MRFLADMGVAMRVVEWLRSQGHGEIAALTHDRVARVILFRLENTRAEHAVARLGAVLSASGDALNRGAILIVEETRHRIRYLPVREAGP